jgi:hypothetical protein
LHAPNTWTGGTMIAQAIRAAIYPLVRRSERTQDLLIVSSFGLWAALLGLAPVLAFHLLMKS